MFETNSKHFKGGQSALPVFVVYVWRVTAVPLNPGTHRIIYNVPPPFNKSELEKQC